MKHQAVPYLSFNGNTREALNYYKDVFAGEISEIQTFGQADFPTLPEADERIMHAKLTKGPLFFKASDSFPGDSVTSGSNKPLYWSLKAMRKLKPSTQNSKKKEPSVWSLKTRSGVQDTRKSKTRLGLRGI